MRRVLAFGLVLALALVTRARRRRTAIAPGAPAALPPPLPSLPAANGDERFVSVPWVALDPAPGRDELLVRYRAPAAATLDRVDVQETDTQLFVTVLVRTHTQALDAGATEATARVALRAPLGERALVPAPLDWPAERSHLHRDHPAA